VRYIVSSKDGLSIDNQKQKKKKTSLKLNEIIPYISMKINICGRILATINKIVVSSTPSNLRDDHNSFLLHDEYEYFLRQLNIRLFSFQYLSFDFKLEFE